MRKSTYYKKRVRQPDPQYNRVDVGLFINYLMKDGKKSVAERVMYDAFKVIEAEKKTDPLKVFDEALENASPRLEVVSRRVGGANYQIPREIRPGRKFFLAANWIIDAAGSQKGAPMGERLAHELIAAAAGEGEAIRRKQTMHKMAEANRAFASFIR